MPDTCSRADFGEQERQSNGVGTMWEMLLASYQLSLHHLQKSYTICSNVVPNVPYVPVISL